MNQMYFFTIKDPFFTKEIVFNTPPLYFNEKTGFKNLYLPDNIFVKGDYNISEPDCLINDSFLKSSINILNYVTHFPLRTLKNLKILKETGRYLIYSINSKYLNQGWFGVAITDVFEKDLPIINEIKLSNKVFDFIADGLINGFLDFGGLAGVFSDYCTTSLPDIFEGLWRQNSLEQVVTPHEGDSTKWDFFIQDHNGLPLTNIIRYDSRINKVFALDMNRLININGVDNPIEIIHYSNCASLSGCYNVCKNDGLGSLKHLSSILANNKGFGFTFIDELTFVDNNFLNPSTKNLLLNVDVKNRQLGRNKYINRLFGNERSTLRLIKKKVMNNKRFINIVNSLKEGQISSELEAVFKSILIETLID